MFIIGVSGGTGSGKTTVVNQILEAIPNTFVTVISQDSYYKDTSHLSKQDRVKINFDHPSAIDFPLLISHLQDLKNNKTVFQPVYSFIEHNRTDALIETKPTKILILEGILIFSEPHLRDLIDLKIFIDVDTDERLIRRLKRDIAERGRDLNEVITRYQTTLKPMHKQFIEPTKVFANIIIPNNYLNKEAINAVQHIIQKYI